MKTIIIEDEKPAARRLERMLVRNNVEVITKLYSVKESIAWLSNNPNPELIFLDIQLSDGLSFEIFEEVQVSSAIIFTTAYDEYALKAFKLNSIDYLLKPIDEDELIVAISQFKNQKKETIGFDINTIKQLLQKEEERYKKRFTVRVGQHLKIVDVKEIECIYSEDKASYAFSKTNKTHLLDGSLADVYDELNPTQFFKVNRQFIVNIDAIGDIISYSNSRLQIKLNNYTEKEIIVSREKVKEFKDWLG